MEEEVVEEEKEMWQRDRDQVGGTNVHHHDAPDAAGSHPTVVGEGMKEERTCGKKRGDEGERVFHLEKQTRGHL